MSEYLIEKSKYIFSGELKVPGDKSISHRAVILSTFNKDMTKITNLLLSDDVKSTMYAVGSIGVMFAENNGKIFTRGTGIREYLESPETIDCGNSGTTARLLTGLLSGQNFKSVLDGDKSLRLRPMDRVKEPLEKIGANISTNNGNMPITINPSKINGGNIKITSPSAQVKSAVILAGLTGDSELNIELEIETRNHTEIMLNNFTENIKINGNKILITPDPKIINDTIDVPNDPSSAAFFIIGALLNVNSHLILSQVCINPSRVKFIDILKEMGADISFENKGILSGEPVADIVVKSSSLKGINISKNDIPKLIDEIPVIALAMSLAQGDSKIEGLNELRFKESDRITSIVSQLSILGANIKNIGDDIEVSGVEELKGGLCDSFNDHRIAMMIAIASTRCKNDVKISNYNCVDISYPNFFESFTKFKKD